MFRVFFVFLAFITIFFQLSAQKEDVPPIRLITATQSNSGGASTQRTTNPNVVVKKGHDVYSIEFITEQNCNLKVTSLWIKDKTTIPLYIDNEKKSKAANFRKGDKFILRAEANGIYPYQKPPKRFNSLALIECEINREKYYIEVKTFLKE